MGLWGIKQEANEISLEQLRLLKWPQNRFQLASLSISAMQLWYLSQDSRYMIFLGQNKEFKRFIKWHYTMPVRCLRFYYKIKRMFIA